MKPIVKERRYKLPNEFQGVNLNTAKAWAAFKGGKIVKAILMCDCPAGVDFKKFREESRAKLTKIGALRSGYVVFFSDKNKNYFCQLTNNSLFWYN